MSNYIPPEIELPLSVEDGGTDSSTIAGAPFLAKSATPVVTGTGTYLLADATNLSFAGSYTGITLPAYTIGENRQYTLVNNQATSIPVSVQGSDVFKVMNAVTTSAQTLGIGQVMILYPTQAVANRIDWLVQVVVGSQSIITQTASTFDIVWGTLSTRYSNTGNATATLPLGNQQVPTIHMVANHSAAGVLTVQRGGSETIRGPFGSVTSFTLAPNSSVILVSGGTVWRTMGDSVAILPANRGGTGASLFTYGTATLSGGTVPVVDATITANSVVIPSTNVDETIRVSINAGVGFTFTSSNASSTAPVYYIRVN